MNLCVLASGRGSNLNSIINFQKKGKIRSKVALVISNNSNSNALNIARKYQIPAVHLSQKQYNSEPEFVNAFLETLQKHRIDLIVLAGYMKMVPLDVISTFKNRIINIHPALIPSFCGQGFFGMKVHEAVIESGVKLTGVTVHFVDEVYDNGPIILQVPVKVKDNDTPETLQKRVLKYEHRSLPEAIKLLESKKFTVVGRKVVFN
ncbi:MAG: phosphoribosylglycinamide formyltransferase [Ignavibacteria bacterium]